MKKLDSRFQVTFAGILFCVSLLLLILLITSFPDMEKQTRQTVEGGGVIITFDDYYAEDWYNANRVLRNYDWKATFFVTRFHTFTSKEVEMLKKLQSQGHEIALHGKNHVNVLEFTSANSLQEYLDEEILPALKVMEQEGFEISSFAYPFGAEIRPQLMDRINKLVFADNMDAMDKLLLEHLDIIRGTTYKQDSNKTPPSDNFANGSRLVFGLGIDNTYGHKIEDLLSLVQYAKENDKIVIFYGHKILQDTEGENYATDYQTLESLCEFVTENNMRFLTMRDLIINKPFSNSSE